MRKAVMGVNCCRCGKNFDYEKYNGICPKCAAYNRPKGQTPYDYDVQKDISARYETMDDSHAKLHRMYDSAPAHRPDKQHAEYHRQYDNNYKHSQQGQSAAPNYRANQAQGQNGAPNYRANQAQMPNGVPNYRGNQAQMPNGVPNYRTNQTQMPNAAPNYRGNQVQTQGGAPTNRAYQMQGQNAGNPPQGNPRKSIAVKVFLLIIIFNVIITFVQAFYK